MKRLSKKIHSVRESVEAYSSCFCAGCACSCLCSDYLGMMNNSSQSNIIFSAISNSLSK